MIYALDISKYPTESIEEIKYQDENAFEWRIARVENGFFIRYFGGPYFKDNTFECQLRNGKEVRIKNTNCIFVKDTDFETFAEVRNVIKLGYTDDIWDVIREMFEERLEHDLTILESEIVN